MAKDKQTEAETAQTFSSIANSFKRKMKDVQKSIRTIEGLKSKSPAAKTMIEELKNDQSKIIGAAQSWIKSELESVLKDDEE